LRSMLRARHQIDPPSERRGSVDEAGVGLSNL
jgi:hypothetical protein